MEAVWQFFKSINALIPEYPRWVFWGAIVIVLALSQLAKLPIKHFTGKIPDENLRQKINTVIMLLPIAFGFLASWALTCFGFDFSVTAALVWGSTSQVIYGFVERLIKRVKNGEDITNDTLKEDITEAKETAEDRFNAILDKVKKGE